MLTFPNILSILRFPLAILFIYDSMATKVLAIALAGLSDFLDGYLARRYQQTSRIGTVLDPIADKFFVVTALSTFLLNGQMSIFEACAMLCRDFSVIVFGFYLLLSGNIYKYHFRSIWSGKLTTTAQLLMLTALTVKLPVQSSFYSIFVFLGGTALIELYLSDHSFIPPELKRNKKSKKQTGNI
ncbi:MAG: CDP-alcohol phosphatidyltransferase family protein [Chlamydiota bacterium]